MAKRAPREGEGRPTGYTIDLGKEICKRISQGETVRAICKDENMPCAASIYNWLLDDDKKEFLDQYEKAKNIQAELMFEELLEIADDGSNDYMEVISARAGGLDDEDAPVTTIKKLDSEHIQRSRLRTDVRKWYLSKVLPKKFGEKLDVESGGKPLNGNVIVIQDFSHGADKTDSK